jgi:hypothetical protein
MGFDAFSVDLQEGTKLRGHQTGRLGHHDTVGTFEFECLGRPPAHRDDALMALLSVDEHFTASTPARPVETDDAVLMVYYLNVKPYLSRHSTVSWVEG